MGSCRDDRLREYASETPETLYPMTSRSPALEYAPDVPCSNSIYGNGAQGRAGLEAEDRFCEGFNGSEYDDVSDSDSDDDDGVSHQFYDSSASPEAVAHESMAPSNSRYGSLEAMHLPSSSAAPRSQNGRGTSTRKSATSTGPRRTSKAISSQEATATTANGATSNDRSEDDQMLIMYREQGLSYKAIKEKMGVGEAESTLRGRHRALVLPKDQRLRRPKWKEQDVSINPQLAARAPIDANGCSSSYS